MNSYEKLHTRKDFENLLLDILNPLLPYYSDGNANLNIGNTSAHYEDRSIPMEAFARPLWGLVPYLTGGGSNEKFVKIYQKGLAEGCNPHSVEFWGTCRDFDQKFVEMASIAYALLMVPEIFWDPLSEEEKKNLAEWLWQINEYECSYSNWQFFCILVNTALLCRGMPYSRERMELGLSRIESYYDAGGWYRDGEGGQKDYYVGFAIVFYSVIYSMFMKEKDPQRCERFIERAKQFGKEFIYWFGEDGGAVPYGRSQTYRFAQAAFFSICAAAEIEVFPLPVMKGIVVRHLQYWMDRQIFDNAHILTIGYGYPNLHMAESYNAPGSPYWGLKVFACLALPEDHPFWTAEEAPLPVLEKRKVLAHADMLVQRTQKDVILFTPGRILPHQHAQSEEKYSKFAYSEKYGFSIARSQKTLSEAAPDSVLSFGLLGHIFVKARIDAYEIHENYMRMEWSPVEGINVCTEIELTQNGHIRTHEIESIWECMAYDAGFAVPFDGQTESGDSMGEDWVQVHTEKGYCRVEQREGYGVPMLVDADPNTNLLHSKTAIPLIVYKIKKGRNIIKTEIISD